MKKAKTDASTIGSYFGHDIRCTKAILREKLGKPQYDDPNEKVSTVQWVLETEDGLIFWLYDMHNENAKETDFQDFHIGANDSSTAQICKDYLIHFIVYGTEKHPGA